MHPVVEGVIIAIVLVVEGVVMIAVVIVVVNVIYS